MPGGPGMGPGGVMGGPSFGGRGGGPMPGPGGPSFGGRGPMSMEEEEMMMMEREMGGRGPGMMGGPSFGGPEMMNGGDPRMMMNDMGPRMMNDPRMMDEGGAPRRGGPPQPDGNQSGPAQQRNFYEVLRVPPTASRSQIKQSYLELAKRYDARSEGGRRSREFNESEFHCFVSLFVLPCSMVGVTGKKLL